MGMLSDEVLDALDNSYGGDLAEYLGDDWRGIFALTLDPTVERIRELEADIERHKANYRIAQRKLRQVAKPIRSYK